MRRRRTVARVLGWLALVVAFGSCGASVVEYQTADEGSNHWPVFSLIVAALVLAVLAFALGAGRMHSQGGGAPAVIGIILAILATFPLAYITFGSTVIEGRPLRRRGRWAHRASADPAVDEVRSVPAFAELSLALGAVGAPLELIRRCHEAALDEVRHARSAAALSGVDVETVSLPELRRPRRPPRARTSALAKLAVESYLDGCVGEGRAVADAAARLRTTDDNAVRAHLEMVVADESRHAALAWDILAFAHAAGGAPVHTVLRLALRRTAHWDDDVAAASRARLQSVLAA